MRSYNKRYTSSNSTFVTVSDMLCIRQKYNSFAAKATLEQILLKSDIVIYAAGTGYRFNVNEDELQSANVESLCNLTRF